jgi:hypothetical protein
MRARACELTACTQEFAFDYGDGTGALLDLIALSATSECMAAFSVYATTRHVAEVEDQALAAGLASQVVSDFHVAAPLARAGRDSMLGADRVSSVRKRGPSTETNQPCAVDAPE